MPPIPLSNAELELRNLPYCSNDIFVWAILARIPIASPENPAPTLLKFRIASTDSCAYSPNTFNPVPANPVSLPKLANSAAEDPNTPPKFKPPLATAASASALACAGLVRTSKIPAGIFAAVLAASLSASGVSAILLFHEKCVYKYL